MGNLMKVLAWYTLLVYDLEFTTPMLVCDLEFTTPTPNLDNRGVEIEVAQLVEHSYVK